MLNAIMLIIAILAVVYADYVISYYEDSMLFDGEYEDYYGRDESEPADWTEEMEREYYGLD